MVWVVARVVMALFFEWCGVGPGVFLMLFFGVNARTVAVSAGLMAGAVLLACAVDGALRDALKVQDAGTGTYAKRIKTVMLVAGVILGCAVLVFIGLVVLGVMRSVR